MAMDDESKGSEPDSPGSDDSAMGVDPQHSHLHALRGEQHPRLPLQQQQPYRMGRARVQPSMPSIAILPMRARRVGMPPLAAPGIASRPAASHSSNRLTTNWSRAVDEDELEASRENHAAAASASSSAAASVPSLADQERFQVSLEIERRFRALLLTRLGFQIVPQAEDGNCMFRSIAHQVYGDSELHAMVRESCMNYVAAEREFFREFIAGETFEAYIQRMKTDGEWGDNVELQAMSEIYERPIEIYAYSDKPLKTFMSAAASSAAAAAAPGSAATSAASASSSSSAAARAPPQPIRMSYHFASHYNSVIHPLQHERSYRSQPPPGQMEHEALARVARMRLLMAEQHRAAQQAAAASAASSSSAASSASSSAGLPGSLADGRSAFSSIQNGAAANPSGFDQAVAASLSELDAAFELEVNQAQQQSLESRAREEAQMMDAVCKQSERDDLDQAIAAATAASTSAAAAAQPHASTASASSNAGKTNKTSVEEEVLQRALAASLAGEDEQLAQALRMSAAAGASSPSSAAAAAHASDAGLQSALRASMGESAQLPRSVQACMEFGFPLEAAVQAYELCNTPQAQQPTSSPDAAHDMLVQRMMDYLCSN